MCQRERRLLGICPKLIQTTTQSKEPKTITKQKTTKERKKVSKNFQIQTK